MNEMMKRRRLLALVGLVLVTTAATTATARAGTVGACCTSDGVCVEPVSEADCLAFGGTYQGDGVACTTVECLGACCRVDGTCDETGQSGCLALGGVWFQGEACLLTVCPQPTGGCCFDDGSCSVEEPANCDALGGFYQGDGTDCNIDCGGACCLPNGTCTVGALDACLAGGGSFQGFGSDCATSFCGQVACCLLDGTCQDLVVFTCDAAGGFSLGEGSSCATIEVQADSFNFDLSPNQDVLTFGKFNEMGGLRVLQKVTTILSGRIAATVTVENLSPNLFLADPFVHLDGSLEMMFPNLPLMSISFDRDFLSPPGTVLDPNDGNPGMGLDFFDFGELGETGDAMESATDPPTDLSFYVGAGSFNATVFGEGSFQFGQMVAVDLVFNPFFAEGTAKVVYQFAVTGACCLVDGTCIQVPGPDCTAIGGTFEGEGVSCTAVECRDACCLPDGTCTPATPPVCQFIGGIPQGPGSTCDDVICAPEEHPGWNFIDNLITLTPNQPVYWSAFTGQPGGGGVSPFTVLDPSNPPGRPAMDGTGDRVLRGFIVGWAVDDNGEEISWNHLAANGTIVNYRDGFSWEYPSVNHAVVSGAADGDPSDAIPGRLALDGVEYAPAFDHLLMNFQAAGSTAFGPPGFAPRVVASNTDVTLQPVSFDARLGIGRPVTTDASYVVWNSNEVKFSGARRCVTCWDETLLGLYGAPNHFLRGNLQTDHGKARINGIASPFCNVDFDPNDGLPLGDDPNDVVSEDAAIAGISARLLQVDPGLANEDWSAAGNTLVGIGTQSAVIRYDTLAPLHGSGLRGRGDAGGAAAAGPVITMPVASTIETGSFFLLSKVELRWSGVAPYPIAQDTFISLTNDSDGPVKVQMYFVNGDQPLP